MADSEGSGAKWTAAEITEAFHKDRALEDIAQVQAQQGDLIGAKKTLAGITERNLRDLALVRIALEKGENVSDAQQSAEKITDAETKEIALVSIGKAQAHNGDTIGAKQTFLSAQQMVEKIEMQSKVNALLRIVRAIDEVTGSR